MFPVYDIPSTQTLRHHNALHAGLFSKRRQLILTDAPRLFYICPKTLTYKGCVPMQKGYMSVTVAKGTSFDIKVPGRTYHFTDMGARGTAERWKDEIEKFVGMRRASQC